MKLNLFHFGLTIIAILNVALSPAPAQDSAGRRDPVVLGVNGAQFTIDGGPTFLLGFSYYGALGAPEKFVSQDLKQFRECGFNWLRVWATWSAFGEDVSAVDREGKPREPYLGRLRDLVSKAASLGMIVDVTLNRGEQLPNFDAHQRAVETLVTELKSFQNWYLDLANERDVGDARFVSVAELQKLRARVRKLDPTRLVTASFGGHDLSPDDVRDAVVTIGVDFLCPHRPRHPGSPGETEAATAAGRCWKNSAEPCPSITRNRSGAVTPIGSLPPGISEPIFTEPGPVAPRVGASTMDRRAASRTKNPAAPSTSENTGFSINSMKKSGPSY